MFQVLFTGCTFGEERIEKLKQSGISIVPASTDLNEKELIVALRGMDGFIMGGDEIATSHVIQNVDKLRVIAFLGAGYSKYVDIEAARSRGIIVTNTPKANAYSVAEFTVAMILSMVKNIPYLNTETKKRIWGKSQTFTLQGKTLGIIGMGAIGECVARTMKNGFGMNILYCSKTRKARIESELNAQFVDKQQLAKLSDIISIHASYSDETINMIGESEFLLTKQNTILINTARAELVEGHALYNALVTGKLKSAAFDCYYSEPLPDTMSDVYKLLSLPDDKFIITPHTAYNTADAIAQMESMVIESIECILQGKEVKFQVN